MSNTMISITIEIITGIILLSLVVLTVYASLTRLRSSKSNLLKKYGTEETDKINSTFEKILSCILFVLIVLLIVLMIIN